MIFKRKAYQDLINWKNESNGTTCLLIEGARRVGKSTLARELGKNEYRSYIEINLAKPRQGTIMALKSGGDKLDDVFNQLSVIYGKPLYERDTLFIFDEVQKYPFVREMMKDFVADGRYDFIETGSLISIKQNVEGILIPSEEVSYKLNPMDFEEFCWAIGNEVTISFLRGAYHEKKPLGNLLKTINESLRLYMLVGGMPQAILAYNKRHLYADSERAKSAILALYRKDIAKYAGSYVAEARALFDFVPTFLSHHDKKTKFKATKVGDRFDSQFANALFWLSESGVCNHCYAVDEPSEMMDLALSENKLKTYLLDTGLLITLASPKGGARSNPLFKSFVLGKTEVNKGMLMENFLAQSLVAFGYDLRFLEVQLKEGEKAKKYEVDFLLPQGKKVLLIEVKSGKEKKHVSLEKVYYHFKGKCGERIIFSMGDYRVEDGVTYLPLAMLFPFLEESVS